MVQSKGTRFDSHLFKIDFTGKRKYSGRSSDLRRVGAGGEIEARRAMPTSGAAPSGARPGTTSVVASFAATTASFRKSRELRSAWPQEAGAGGGQSAPLLNGTMSETISEKGLPGPESGASSSVRVFGLRSGQTGKREAEENGARRRIGKPAGFDEERTGDIAHLGTGEYFAFCSPCQELSLLIRIQAGDGL
jgi:hypothetical protein